MACEWRTVDGLRFLYADYRGADTAAELLAVLEEQVALIEEQAALIEAEGRGVRLLIHVDGNQKPPTEFLNAVKHTMRHRLEPFGLRVAFVGIAGVGRLVLRGLQLVGGGFGVVAFDDVDRAVAYLNKH